MVGHVDLQGTVIGLYLPLSATVCVMILISCLHVPSATSDCPQRRFCQLTDKCLYCIVLYWFLHVFQNSIMQRSTIQEFLRNKKVSCRILFTQPQLPQRHLRHSASEYWQFLFFFCNTNQSCDYIQPMAAELCSSLRKKYASLVALRNVMVTTVNIVRTCRDKVPCFLPVTNVTKCFVYCIVLYWFIL